MNIVIVRIFFWDRIQSFLKVYKHTYTYISNSGQSFKSLKGQDEKSKKVEREKDGKLCLVEENLQEETPVCGHKVPEKI